MTTSNISVKGYSRVQRWPKDIVRSLYESAKADNWVLAVEPDSLNRLLSSWVASEAVLFLAYNSEGTCVGGVTASVGDVHMSHVMSVDAAMIPVEYRNSTVTRKLYTAVRDLAKFMQCTHISTSVYSGNGKYITKYKVL